MQSSYFETELRELDKSVINGIRAALGVSGLVSLIVGVMILAWPAKTAVVVAGFIAVYAAIVGLADLAVGIFSRKLGAWPRVGHLVVGVVFIVSAAVALGNLGAAATGLAILLGIVVGIVWIFEGVAGLTMIGDAPSKAWTLGYAVVSVIAGILLLTSPLWGAALLWLLLGMSLVVMGVVQLVRAVRFGAR